MNKKTNSSTTKKKSLGLRIFVLVLAVSLLLGIIILPLQSFAVESDTEAVIVTEFETGRLSDALLEAADGTDYNYIKKAAVSGGTLSAEDYSALQNMPNLEYIELAGAETKDGIIPENALPSRNQLTFISLPKNTVEIGAKAFSGNRKLVKVSMPDSVTKIDDYAFESCEALSDIPVTENITYIGEGAFRDCKSITFFTRSIEITSDVSGNMVYKGEDVKLRITVSNKSIFPVPAVRIVLKECGGMKNRNGKENYVVSIQPKGSTVLEADYKAESWGKAALGAKSVFITDFLDLFSLDLHCGASGHEVKIIPNIPDIPSDTPIIKSAAVICR